MAAAKRGRRFGRVPIGARRRWSILQRDKFTCQFCGSRPGNDRLHVDHILPWSLGGSDHDNNLATACDRCNGGKSDRIAVPDSMCEGVATDGWKRWRSWGGWNLAFTDDAMFLDYQCDQYPIAIDRVHESDWLEHISFKPWSAEMKHDFADALSFARTLIDASRGAV